MTKPRKWPDVDELLKQVRAGILDHSSDEITIAEHLAAMEAEKGGKTDKPAPSR